MRTVSLLLFITIVRVLPAQNGWSAYITSAPSNFVVGFEGAMLTDKKGDKWIGFSSSSNSSPAAVAWYHKNGGFWTYHCSSNTPAFLSNRVNALACDTSGNVWIGTLNGLVKYDGIIFSNYTTANGLPSNNILSLHCQGNMLYIGTAGGGLSRFDGTSFTNYNKSNTLLGNDTINCITAENNNTLWLGGTNRLIQFSINSSFTSTSYTNLSVPAAGKLCSIHATSDGSKWIATLGKGLLIYDNTSVIPAITSYSNLLGAQIPTVSCYDISKGPNNGVCIVANCGNWVVGGFNGPLNTCIIEFLPGKNYKVYYPPAAYTLGSYIEYDQASGSLFTSYPGVINTGNFLKLMFEFNQNFYDGFGLGPSFGVTDQNFKFLDINRVRAGISNRGDMHWDLGNYGQASYEVPKGSGTHAAFASNLWLGGLDASNQLHAAAQTYRQQGSDFWPGPLDTINASIDTATCKAYDKIWKVNYQDINDFIYNFTAGNIANNTYTPSIDIINWPAKGTGNLSRNLAPFVDVNNNGIYDPLTGGDYPNIKGDECLYFIFNDKLVNHAATNGLPFGVEIHGMAYAYGCPGVLNGRNELAYTTFYNYRIINRSNTNYHSMYLGFDAEVDLGNYNDDFIACRPQDNLGFCYNADGFDETTSVKGYGNYPPASGTSVLKGPPAPLNDGIDNNNDGNIDEAGEECLMNKFVFYNNISTGTYSAATVGPTAPQASPDEYYTYLEGLWKDSTSFTCGGNCYGGTTPTSFVYPWSYYTGMPCSLWADGTIPKGDRRYIISTGPFDLAAKQEIEIEYAYVWSVDSSSANDNIASASKLIIDAQKIKQFYDLKMPSPCLPVGVKEEKKDSRNEIAVYPNPAGNLLYVKHAAGSSCAYGITDVFGRLMASGKTDASGKTPVPVSSLAAGVYFISLKQDDKISTVKFVKE